MCVDLRFPRGFVAFVSSVHGHACAIHPRVAMDRMTDCDDLDERFRRLMKKHSKTKGGIPFSECDGSMPWQFSRKGDFRMLGTVTKTGRIKAAVMHHLDDPRPGPEIVLTFTMGSPEHLMGKPCLSTTWNVENGWKVQSIAPYHLQYRMDRVQFLALFDRWLASVNEPTIIQAIHGQAVCQSDQALFDFEKWLSALAEGICRDPRQALFPHYFHAAKNLFPTKRSGLPIIPAIC